jgi:Squalene-hopene cyclase N-terminal domain
MSRLAAAVLAFVFVSNARPADPAADTNKAIDQGLKFLAQEGLEWKAIRKCASCHHAPMTIWALNEAKKYGHRFDDKAVTALTNWVLAKDDPGKVNPKQPERKEVNVNQSPLMLALGIGASNNNDKATTEGLKSLLSLVLAGQSADGAWRLQIIWEPIGSTPDVITSLAMLALTNPNAPDLGNEGKAAREKGLKWLEANPAIDNTQSIALRLILWRRLARPATECEPLVRQLAAKQNTDGGWSQAKDFRSDAFATGQALYALSQAEPKSDDPTILKARAFLVKTQDEDGYWDMASRPGGPGGKSAKDTDPITHAGTAWAVLGLIRSTPRVAGTTTPTPRP